MAAATGIDRSGLESGVRGSSARFVGAKDVSGYEVFSAGDLGGAHVRAHELLDAGRHVEGRRALQAVLDGRDGSGSDWVHLQWHLAVFELATGERTAPLERFRAHVLPAVPSGDALTDAPSLLWRLRLAGVALEARDREPVQEVALGRIGRGHDPYVEVHHLLALGATGDVDAIDRWLRADEAPAASSNRPIVRQLARGLRAFAVGDYRRATRSLALGARAISWIGGSQGQNRLFGQLRDEAARHADLPAPVGREPDRALAIG